MSHPTRHPTTLLARLALSALLATVLLALVGPPGISGAESVQRELLTVKPDGARVTTTAELRPGVEYRIEVEGTITHDGRDADAECSTSTLDPLWMPDREGLDLLVDGTDVEWTPRNADVLGCDADHRYSIRVAVPTARPLSFAIDLTAKPGGSGELLVAVTGPGLGSPAASAPAAAPAPAASEPAPAPRPAPAPSSEPQFAASPAPAPAAPAAADPGGTRELSTAELLDLLGADSSAHESTDAPAGRTIELAVAPGAGSFGGEQGSGPAALTWLLVFALISTVVVMLMPPEMRYRLAKKPLEALVTAGEELGKGQTKAALAHRAVDPTVGSVETRPTVQVRRRARTTSAVAHRS